MRLLMTTSIFPPDSGGPATYVPLMAEGLARRGHEVTVLTLSDEAGETTPTDSIPFRVVRVPRRLNRAARALALIRAIHRHGSAADLHYCNSGMLPEAGLTARMLRKPYLLKVVGDGAWELATRKRWSRSGFDDFQTDSGKLRIELLKRWRSGVVRLADRVLVPSRYLGRIVEGWGIPGEKVSVVYNAVETPGEVRPAAPVFPGALNVVTVGRLVPWKHLDLVLEALAALPENVRLVVVGDGPERQALEARSRALGVEGRARFLGRRSNADTLSIVAGSDVFVLNSTYEGLPHVVLEAMNLGVPTVATAAGGTPEVVSDRVDGCLIPPMDPRALADTLLRLSGDVAERRRLGAEARKSASRFRTDRMIEETEALLAGMAGA